MQALENKVIASRFKLLGQLMELHDENPFKIKAVNNASFKLDKLPFKIVDHSQEELSQQPGIGKSTAAKVWELLQTGKIGELEALLSKTPEGVLEMLSIKGIGPKKIHIIWHSLGIETLGELYYACNENRLVEAKGFGLKTQEEIRKAIEFNMANEGLFLYSQAEKVYNALLKDLRKSISTGEKLLGTGDFRRCNEILSILDLITTAAKEEVLEAIEPLTSITLFDQKADLLECVHESGLPVHIHLSSGESFAQQLFLSTGNERHVQQMRQRLKGIVPQLASEEAIYAQAGMDYIAPELREGLDELSLALSNQLPTLITESDLKGTLHNHSTWSDGVHTLQEMAIYCKEQLGLQYLGICDHSQAAVYANGLTATRVQAQWAEIDRLNEQLAPFKIFKGIESDILGDGSLDYEEEILKGFDFVVASVHSNLRMDEEKATKRLIKAIENPYTTILGHPTGRLLLARKGYPIDHKKVIDACAANEVVIEINANPLRLDLDWRWHRYALDKGVMLSINPDAHRTEGFHDMHYGVLVARKGGLSKARCLNCLGLDDITAFFAGKKVGI